MSDQDISPENVVSLVDRILKAKDPAVVGLKRILKKKEDERTDYPLRQVSLEEFDAPGKVSKAFSEDERHILTLEKKVADLKVELKKQKERATQAIQTAYANGKKEGFNEGRTEGTTTTTEHYEKIIDELQKRITAMFRELETSKRSVFSNAEHMLLRLTNEMVRKIIDCEISVKRDIVLSVLKRALNYIGHREKMVVRVAPNDLERVTKRKDFWFPVSDRLEDIVIEADERIAPGGCIVESNSGLVDAQLGVQFSELTDLIEKIWTEVTSAAEKQDADIPDMPEQGTE